MPILFLMLLGAGAGFLATRMMHLKTGAITTVAIGVFGALVAGLLLRLILTLGGIAFWFVAAVLGAMLVIWLIRIFLQK